MLKINEIYKKLRLDLPDNILRGESKVILGFSGGPDSRLLLDFLSNSIKNPKNNLIVAHVNYKLRENESDKDENLVTNICKNENLLLEKHVHILDKNSKGIQEKARKIRLDFFRDLSIKYRTNKIFLGHNYNDHVETIMLNIIRGSGLNGLEGIKIKNRIRIEENTLEIFRPLIKIKKPLIEEICNKKNLEFVIDSSNKKNDYSRNKLRNQIIPEIEKINPKFLDSVNSLSNLIKKRKSKKKIKFGKYKGIEISEGIKLLSYEYSKLRINSFLGRTHYEMFENILLGNSLSQNLPENIRLFRNDDNLVFEDLSEKKIKLELNKKISIPGKTILSQDFQIITRVINKPQNIKQTNKNLIYINEKYYDQNLYIRIRNNGDRINSISNIYTRVKKVLSNYKNIKDKKNALILESNNEILWIVGIKQSISSYVEKNNKKVLEIKLLENPI